MSLASNSKATLIGFMVLSDRSELLERRKVRAEEVLEKAARAD